MFVGANWTIAGPPLLWRFPGLPWLAWRPSRETELWPIRIWSWDPQTGLVLWQPTAYPWFSSHLIRWPYFVLCWFPDFVLTWPVQTEPEIAPGHKATARRRSDLNLHIESTAIAKQAVTGLVENWLAPTIARAILRRLSAKPSSQGE